MAMEAAGEATSAASPLADDVRDAVVADAISRATRTIACQNRARAGSAASRRCSLLRADSVKGESLFVAPLKLLTPITHLFSLFRCSYNDAVAIAGAGAASVMGQVLCPPCWSARTTAICVEEESPLRGRWRRGGTRTSLVRRTRRLPPRRP